MRNRLAPKTLLALAALPCLLSLTACGSGNARPAFIKPAPERTVTVARPTIPEAKTPCAHDPAKLCLNDEQTAGLLAGFAEALDRANDKLQWLADYFKRLP